MKNLSTSRRLSHRETAAALGINLGEMDKLRAEGARLHDPSFPKISNGTFDKAEVLAWKAARDNRNAQPPSPPRDRRTDVDRRKL